jgi:transposase
MEACGGSHFWGREIGKLGHEVRLIPPVYVKPFVKRKKTDAVYAELSDQREQASDCLHSPNLCAQ